MFTRSKKRRTMMTLSTTLPDDMVKDVCSRLPVQSLVRFKSVSKSWHNMVTDPSFANFHLNRSKTHNTSKEIMFFFNDLGQLYSLDYQNSDQFIRVYHRMLGHCKVILASCNGLVLCRKRYNGNKRPSTLYIWNPCTGENKKLNLPDKRFWPAGFGSNLDFNDYEVVTKGAETITRDMQYSTEVRVYSLYKDSWRVIPNIPYLTPSYSGLLFNGCLVWEAYNKDSRRFLVAFRIGGDEMFTVVPLPEIQSHRWVEIIEFQGSIGFLDNEDGRRFDLWVMKDYGVMESWTKLFTIDLPGISLAKHFGKDSLVVTSGFNNVLNLYELKTGSNREITGGPTLHYYYHYGFSIESYVESIVRVDNRHK